MKTYCWKCEKQTIISNPEESKRSELLIRGNCGVCGVITSKTLTRKANLEE
jgi:hypothetical protein